MSELTLMYRIVVRQGWLQNAHINVPAELKDAILGQKANANVTIWVERKPCGGGAIQGVTGHLTGVAQAFERLNVDRDDVDKLELRIWVRWATVPEIHLERTPMSSAFVSADLPNDEDNPDAEVFYVDKESATIYAYRGVRASGRAMRRPIEWLFAPIPVPSFIRQYNASALAGTTPPSPLQADRTREAIEIAVLGGSGGQAQRAEESDHDEGASEGGVQIRLHAVRERSSRLARAKRREVQAMTGKLACEVCTFDFAEQYGARGRDFCEVHHTIPLASLGESQTTTLADLAVVCPNCHRMLHREPFLSIDELRAERGSVLAS